MVFVYIFERVVYPKFVKAGCLKTLKNVGGLKTCPVYGTDGIRYTEYVVHLVITKQSTVYVCFGPFVRQTKTAEGGGRSSVTTTLCLQGPLSSCVTHNEKNATLMTPKTRGKAQDAMNQDPKTKNARTN